MKQKTLILVLACILAIALADEECPSREDVYPCRCWGVNGLGANIKCVRMNSEQLAKLARNLKGWTVWILNIEDSKLGGIPHDVFKGVEISELSISKSTLVGEAFAGLDSHLVELEIHDCVFKDKWNWNVLGHLKKLTHLTIRNSLHLETIETDDMKVSVPSLELIYFSGNNISVVTDRAFDSHKNVRYLYLDHNRIKNVKRTMLPDPALKLTLLDLGGNLIEQIPEDMFTNMPVLDRLYINTNKILVLDEKTFAPVWEQLTSFHIFFSQLRCDCRMSWILQKKAPVYLEGECASPPELHEKKLTYLESKDFVCHV